MFPGFPTQSLHKKKSRKNKNKEEGKRKMKKRSMFCWDISVNPNVRTMQTKLIE